MRRVSAGAALCGTAGGWQKEARSVGLCEDAREEGGSTGQRQLLQLCLEGPGSAVGRISMGHRPPEMSAPLLPLDHGLYQARDLTDRVGFACPPVATVHKFS